MRARQWLFPPGLLLDWQAQLVDLVGNHDFDEPLSVGGPHSFTRENQIRMIDAIAAHPTDREACFRVVEEMASPFVAAAVAAVTSPERGRAVMRVHRMNELRTYQQLGLVRAVRILSIIDWRSCLACVQHDGATYTLAEALRTNPLPCLGCECHRNTDDQPARRICQCSYQAVFDESLILPALGEPERDAARARAKESIIAEHLRRGAVRANAEGK